MQYNIGTISTLSGSSIVSGYDTKWLANINNDSILVISNEDVYYEINNVISDTLLQISEPYIGTDQTHVSYTIVKDYTVNFGWPTISRGAADWPTIVSETFKRIDRDLHNMPQSKRIKCIKFQPIPGPGIDNIVEGQVYYSSINHRLEWYWNNRIVYASSTSVPPGE
jgi:hypothetical protein